MANFSSDSDQSTQAQDSYGHSPFNSSSDGAGIEVRTQVQPPSDGPEIEGFWQELREELLLLETRAGSWLLQAADPTCLGRIQLQQRIDSGESVLMAGEIICDQDIQCLDCGSTFHAHGTVTLPPCQACAGEAYAILTSH